MIIKRSNHAHLKHVTTLPIEIITEILKSRKTYRPMGPAVFWGTVLLKVLKDKLVRELS